MLTFLQFLAKDFSTKCIVIKTFSDNNVSQSELVGTKMYQKKKI